MEQFKAIGDHVIVVQPDPETSVGMIALPDQSAAPYYYGIVKSVGPQVPADNELERGLIVFFDASGSRALALHRGHDKSRVMAIPYQAIYLSCPANMLPKLGLPIPRGSLEELMKKSRLSVPV